MIKKNLKTPFYKSGKFWMTLFGLISLTYMGYQNGGEHVALPIAVLIGGTQFANSFRKINNNKQ